ncbi:UPF0280 family protein [Desulfitobacterium chlororespirans]|uniref:Uncharacterized protein n=1 Tax=Desulfitobacterium chlororespirans DSM 11544 TaxID=1121395 RepID=A0A1M7SHA7_9FIRM|nr:UPF0280 family protein [Desulfitobacterium chlororespirans]SHN57869.1 hypothetical protein SAMN02745215_00853 [Desulfitobacterium chlororespirans DSM 11544]
MPINTYHYFKKSADLKTFTLHVKETHLRISVDRESCTESFKSNSHDSLLRLRSDIEKYIKAHHNFRSSFKPLNIPANAPPIVRCMGDAARAANVGPMAAVAGAIAEALGEELSKFAKEIIIENGGDLYIQTSRRRVIGIFASRTKFSYQIGLEIPENSSPLGLCTSSGTIGSSISLGQADAVVIQAGTASLADAVATATANKVQTPEDLRPALEFANKIPGVTGVLAIKGSALAAWGNLKLVKI